MNTERFKFRVWDVERQGFTSIDPSVLCSRDNIRTLCMKDDNESRFIIEQCTGISDKNGKLIFEGDVLLELKTGKRYKVVWWGCRAGFEMEEIPSSSADQYDKLHPGTMYFANETFGRFEVVGNIHQNQELMR